MIEEDKEYIARDSKFSNVQEEEDIIHSPSQQANVASEIPSHNPRHLTIP